MTEFSLEYVKISHHGIVILSGSDDELIVFHDLRGLLKSGPVFTKYFTLLS